MPNVGDQLCMDIRKKLERLVSNLGGGSFAQKLARADLEEWERVKYKEYWDFVNDNGMHYGHHGARKAKCNEILDDLSWTHKFSWA
tara:strand:- start:394 stop:651 length:258 start_codon:yes stop_codon:yes gene_type:complete